MLFWMACEELKRESNPDSVEEKARLIYEDYISILSPREVRFAYLVNGVKRWELGKDRQKVTDTHEHTYRQTEGSRD